LRVVFYEGAAWRHPLTEISNVRSGRSYQAVCVAFYRDVLAAATARNAAICHFRYGHGDADDRTGGTADPDDGDLVGRFTGISLTTDDIRRHLRGTLVA
jgi:hypothetical protein